ncbi:MAG TPA: hypothetical protein VK752_15180 [Bryobacteraceae bacterium]|jgi:hypothetical protein|nr:hypothetical protein [Bryobacteraceae bacterium]
MTPFDAAKKKAETKLKALAREFFGEPTEAESRMLRAAVANEEAFCGPINIATDVSNAPEFSESGSDADSVQPWDKKRNIRAEMIRWLCTNKDAKKLLDPFGIVVCGAGIINVVQFSGVTVPVPLVWRQCRLLETAVFQDGEIKTLDLSGSWIRDLNLSGAKVQHSVTLRYGFRAEGIVDLTRTEISDDLDLGGAAVVNPSAEAVRGSGLRVGSNVLLRAGGENGDIAGFRAEGSTGLIGAVIGGDLDCDGGEFINPGKTALELERAVIGGAIYLRSVPDHDFATQGAVDLENARCKLFADEKDHWPARGDLSLDGFIYDSVSGGGWDAPTRIAWLERDTSTATQPYRQLAKVLRDAGQEEQARQVLIAMEEKLTSLDPPFKRVPERLFLGPIGYGYRPGRALWGLVAISVLGAVIYRRSKMTPTDKDAANAFKSGFPVPPHYPKFQPVIYSLENTFPLVKLGQGDKWRPLKTGPRWIVWLQILLGWLLATLFVAGIAGVVQHS